MIVRLIVFIAIFFTGLWLYRKFVAFKASQSAKKEQSDEKAPEENMVRCEKCQVFVPLSHAVLDDNKRPFCSKEHLDDFNTQ
ncbi:PP0621 family protein [Marinomonas sp. C2222]|uniref:PP0621 family protein n=1 Tax=Marinomonas sargassi TaxID=2984494 RepID=A0ABT2YTQ0_9GAMM|nr:PP0621 family protein [Marinomonas sargassi]MCV2403273.1 PP0621 family protein [Marinomonas sargassi]